MQLHRSAQFPRSKPQGIPLSPRPRTPFNDHGKFTLKQFLRLLPLQRLHPRTLLRVPQIDAKSLHPLIRTKPNRAKPVRKPLGMSRLPRPRQSTHNNQS